MARSINATDLIAQAEELTTQLGEAYNAVADGAATTGQYDGLLYDAQRLMHKMSSGAVRISYRGTTRLAVVNATSALDGAWRELRQAA